jgi:predicted DNA-binding ribbon-helix-helix protein
MTKLGDEQDVWDQIDELAKALAETVNALRDEIDRQRRRGGSDAGERD